VENIVNSEFPSMTQNFSWLYRGVAEIFPQSHGGDKDTESLEKRLLNSDRPLRIKLGIDPTGADILPGLAILLVNLRCVLS
jgi:tyrosyl-tRNA synthetase